MTEKTHETAVVLIPPRACWNPIQAIRERFDRHIHRWMPHITLLYPFVPRQAFDAAEARLTQALEGMDPFELRLAEFRFFLHGKGSYTLWLAPEPRDRLKHLQSALTRAMPEFDDVTRYPEGFTPHLSVGQARGKNTCEKRLALLEAEWKPIEFIADRIQLIRRDPGIDDVFRVDRFIELR
jgi:2'-5' RNA ligase